MKLTAACHPVSAFMKQLHPTGLSYEAREIACHAIETYAEKLKTNNYDYLKIHCYRALVERIIIRHDPELRRCGLKSVKQKDGLTFREYVRLATANLTHLNITDEELTNPEVEKDAAEWKKVAIFYTLRLFLAPLLESIILLDRMLWILEKGGSNLKCELRATFDPLKSPRNQVMVAIKDDQNVNISNK